MACCITLNVDSCSTMTLLNVIQDLKLRSFLLRKIFVFMKNIPGVSNNALALNNHRIFVFYES